MAKTYAMGGAATLVALCFAGAVFLVGERRSEDPFYRRLAASTSKRLDEEGRASAGCDPSSARLVVSACVLGQPDASRTILVLGDSHAGHWLPALDRAASELGVRVVVRNRGGCPSVQVVIANAAGPLQPSTACELFRRESQRLLDDLRPDAVVLSNAAYTGRVMSNGDVPSADVQLQLWSSALDNEIGALGERGARVGLVLDNPRVPFDPVACISRNGGAAGCSVPESEALELVGPFNDAERRVATGHPGVAVFDPGPLMCDGSACALEVGNEYVYADRDHLASGFTEAQTPKIADFLLHVLGQSR